LDGADATAPEASPVFLGDGDMPADLDRLNWGAFLLTGLWLLVHKLWLWWLVVFLMWWGGLVLFALSRRLPGIGFDHPVQIALVVVYTIAAWGVSYWFGRNVNARLWQRAAQLERGKKRKSVAAYMKGQRIWALAAVAFQILAWYGMVEEALDGATRMAGGVAGVIAYLVLTVVLCAAAWAWDRRHWQTA